MLTAYEERVVVATKALSTYLQRAGVDPELRPKLIEMYGFSKKHVRSVPVDRILADDQVLDGMRFIHTPGHCPGQVCIEIGDVLICADHILAVTTPHQAPESITAYTGLGHYLEALAKVRRMGGFDLALGGHEQPIRDVYRRIDEIRTSHERKLERVSGIINESDAPATISDVTAVMYPKVRGFNTLLALEEVGGARRVPLPARAVERHEPRRGREGRQPCAAVSGDVRKQGGTRKLVGSASADVESSDPASAASGPYVRTCRLRRGPLKRTLPHSTALTSTALAPYSGRWR